MANKAKIGAGISLDGEKEFKQAISAINKDLSVLSSEMKKVSAEFGDNKDSLEALTAKDEVLNKQLDTQKEKIEAIKKALENSKQQYGENDEKTKGWQITLNKAEADLFKLDKELKDNKEAMEKAKNPADDLGKEIKQVGDNADDAGQKTFKMGDMIKANLISEAIIGGVKALGSAIISVAKGIGDAVTETIDYTGEIADMSAKTGVGAEELQKYSYAAKMSGMEMDTLEKAMVKSQKSFADAKTGSKALQNAYRELGIDISKIPNSEEAFAETLAALADMTDETKRNALANDLFGKSYAELAPLLNEGSDGIEALKIKAEELGIVMSEDAVSSGEALGDTLDTLKITMSGVANSLISMLLPGLSSVANDGVGFISEFSKSVQGAGGDMSKIGEVVGTTLSNLVSKIAEKLPEIIKGAESLIISFAGGIKNNLPMIIETGLEIMKDLALSLLDALPEIVETGLEVIVSLANGIANALPELIPAIVDTVMTIVETLIDNVDELIDAAIAIILALADGLIDALPRLIDKIPIIIEKLLAAFAKNSPKLVEAGYELIFKLAAGLIKAVPQILSKIPQIMRSLINGFLDYFENMQSVGRNLVQGIWNGINDAKDWILSKIKGFGSSIVSGIKNIFGIHSPSTVMRDEVGKNLALGLGLGFTDEMKKVTDEMTNSIPTNFDTKVNVSSSSYNSGIGTKSQNFFISNLNVIDKGDQDRTLSQLEFLVAI